MMKVNLVLILGFLLFTFQLSAQNAAQAESLFNNKKYREAAKAYEVLLIRRPNDQLLNYRYGRCLLELKIFDKAVEHLKKAGNKYPAKDFYLAEAFYRNYDFAAAFNLLKDYSSTIDSTDVNFKEVQKKLPVMELTARLINRVEDLLITDSILADKKDFLKHYQLLSEAGKVTQKTIPVGAKILDEMSYFTQRGDRHIQSVWMNGHWDIATSIKLLDDWSDPVSISNQINTRSNENYPFLLSDGITLYFASDGHGSIGGYDIFVTKYASTTKDFVIPENIGFPFNSFANDYMLALDETAQTGWFATDRNQKAGKVMIYQFNLPSEKTFVPVEDSVVLKDKAKLKSYRKGVKTSEYQINNEINNNSQTSTIDLLFEINDSLSYKDKSQFKSAEALKLFEDLQKVNNDLKILQTQLDKLRIAFENATNETDKISLSASILQNEEKWSNLNQKSKELPLKIRQAENKKLSGY